LGPALAEAAGVDFRAEIPEQPRPVRPTRSDRPERTGAPKSSRDRPRRETMRPHRAKPEPEPEVDKPRHRPKAGPRKHVSVLRAEAPAEGRRRTVEGETTDRKGRAVAVERRVAADKPKKSKISAAKRPKRNEAPGARPGRKPVADERRGPKATGGGRQDRRRDGDATRGPALKSGRPGKPRGPASSGKRPPRGRG
jgi:23S rRNA pseudouridine2605 synthase